MMMMGTTGARSSSYRSIAQNHHQSLDEENVSLGSLREFYKELPYQLVEETTRTTRKGSGIVGTVGTTTPAARSSADRNGNNHSSGNNDDGNKSAAALLPRSEEEVMRTNNGRRKLHLSKSPSASSTNKKGSSAATTTAAAGRRAITPSSTAGNTAPTHGESSWTTATMDNQHSAGMMVPYRTSSKSRLSVAAPSPQDEAEHIKVAVRLRPMQPQELVHASQGRRRSRLGRGGGGGSSFSEPARAWQVVMADTNAEGTTSTTTPPTTLFQTGVSKLVRNKSEFTYDAVFVESCSTVQVYRDVVLPVVRAVATGRHGTVFAYGQTGSGKTFTMQGDEEMNVGVIQMALADLLDMTTTATNTSNCDNISSNKRQNRHDRDVVMRAQYFEIYNEQYRDLLVTEELQEMSPHHHQQQSRRRTPAGFVDDEEGTVLRGGGGGGGGGGTRLPILNARLDPSNGNVTVNAHEEMIHSVDDVLRLLRLGNSNRATAATDWNAQSSRSHAIFRVTLESRARLDHHHHNAAAASKDDDAAAMAATAATNNNNNDDQMMMWHSVLNLVDLAGSESCPSTGAARRREGGKINRSLLSLSKVIRSLSLPDKKRPKHIGYRDSKLTRILQPHLEGNASMAILCCASPAKLHLEETRSTLKFAANAKRVKVAPTVNQVVDQRLLVLQLQKELAEAKRTIQRLELAAAQQRREAEEEQERAAANSESSSSESNGGVLLPQRIPCSSWELDDALQQQQQPSARRLTGETCTALPDLNSDALVIENVINQVGHGNNDNNDDTRNDDHDDDHSSERHELIELTEPESTSNDLGSEKSEKGDHQQPPDNTTSCADDDDDDDDCEYHDCCPPALAITMEESSQYKDGSCGDGAAGAFPMNEVVVLVNRSSPGSGGGDNDQKDGQGEHGQDLAVLRLRDAEQRAAFLEEKVEATDDLVEQLSRELEATRRVNLELKMSIVQWQERLSALQRETSETQTVAVLMCQQYALLKGAIYLGLLSFLCGLRDYFLAAVMFLWLCLEVNM